jgi:hypothetical protein
VSARSIQRTRSNAWQSSVAASSAVAFSLSTNDPSASVVAAPMPTFTIHFGRRRGSAFTAPTPVPPLPAAPFPTPLTPKREERPAASNHAIELIIDSLPHYELTEPVPVTIDPLGDAVFTASVRDLDIAAIGNSIGEALLLLKEEIERVYEDLNRRLPSLNCDEKTLLQMLHTYIAPQSTKAVEPEPSSAWYRGV